MKKLYLVICLLLIGFTGNGQALSSYNFSAFTSTYNPVSGSFISPSGGTSWGTTTYDDCYYSGISIGFNFVYCGTTYTTLAASQNCWLVLGHSFPASMVNTYTNDLRNSAITANLPRPILAALWSDIITSGNCVRYATTGSSPNRVFTIEWNNVGFYSSTAARECVEIILYETSNVIDFAYKKVSSGSYSLSLCAIGITGGNGSYPVTGVQPYWSLNGAGSSPTPSMATVTRGISGQPATDQVYRWSPNCFVLAPTATTPVCSGDTLSFTGTVTTGTPTGYLWEGPGGYTSTDQNPFIAGVTTAQAGAYTFTATSSGCADSTTVTVAVDSTPTATISGTTNFCSGGSSNVTFTGTVGATVNYTINGGSTLTATIGSGGTVAVSTGTLTTGSTSTTYTYALQSASMGSCTGVLSGTAVVTVDPNPSAISGANHVCLGATTNLTDADAGGLWSTSAGSIASLTSSGSTATVSGVSPGTATIDYTFSTGCYASLTMTVNPPPTAISGPGAVCPGQTITLTDTGSGTWTTSNASVATAGSTTGIITGVNSGSVIVTYTSAAGCTTVDTITVNPLPSVITGPSAVCVGSAITLSSAPTTGSWTSSAGGIATVTSGGGVVTGVSGGSATITYTLPVTGCYRTDAITVNPLPAAISGTLALCEAGGTTTLTSSGTGRWSSSNTSIATVNPTTGVVTGGTRGTATITYTLTATSCYVTATVTVNPLPKVINGPTAVCEHATITLSDTVTGGVWSSSSTGNATITSSTGIITGVSAGSTTITYFLGTGCSTTVNITVNPVPATITGTLSVCEAGSVTNLSDGTRGGTWTSSDGSIATVDNSSGAVTGVAAGSATITYTLTTTSCYITAGVTVNSLPADISGPSAVCVGSTITLTDVGTGTWRSGTTSLATITGSGVVTGVSAGTDDITFTLTSTGCQKSTPIIVDPLPGTIAGPSVVCAGSSISLGNSAGGGLWASSDTSKATADASGNITGVSAGTPTITYTLGTGCLATTTITVNPLPAAIVGSPAVCYTYTTLLTESTGGGFWSSANSGIASVSGGLVTGVSVGGTTISYTLTATGCYQTISMTVNALPSNISGPTAVCVASSITLTDGTTGSGTWSSNNTGIATIDPSSGVATGVSSGTAITTYTAGGGCFVYRNLTVNPLPAAIGGATAVCEGSTATVTDASGTGTWSSSNTSLATITSGGVVTGVVAGTVDISYTLPTSCLVSIPFTVNTTPVAITGTAEVCEAGSTTTLYDATTGGTWTSGTTGIATVVPATGVVTGVAAGTANITYTLGSCFNHTNVTVRPLPGAIITALGDTMLCPGDFVTLTCNTGAGYTFQWNNGSGAMSGETDDYYVATVTDGFTASVTSNYGCTSTSSTKWISVSPAVATIASLGPTVFCAGTSDNLQTTGGSGLTYQWTNSGAGVSGATDMNYYATAAGDYQAIVTNAAGCYATSSVISISLLPSPSPTLYASGSLTFCSGNHVVLSADTTAGITYQWLSGGVPIAGATTITYTATTTGNYQVREDNSYGCLSNSAIAAVTALPLPSANISASGSTTFCAGLSVVLNAPSVGGNTYQWLRNSTIIGGATTASYLAATGGYYTVKVTAATGCTNVTTPATYVEAVSIPVITTYSGTTFCWGASAHMGVNVTSTASITYQWQMGGVNIPGATNSTYSATMSGSYSCIIDVAGGCTLSAAAVTVTELPLPNPVIYYDGTTLHTTTNYASYEWFRNMIPTGANANGLIPNQTGDYTVKVIDSNGCQSMSSIYILRTLGHNRSLGIGGVNSDDIQIYPNPAQDVLHIVASGEVKVVITSVDGRKVMEQADAHDLSISHLTAGVYMVLIYDGEGVLLKTDKLVKE